MGQVPSNGVLRWMAAVAMWLLLAMGMAGDAMAQTLAQAPSSSTGVALRIQLHQVEEERRAPLTRTASEALERVEGWLQVRVPRPLDIDFVGSEAAFDEVMKAHNVHGWDERWLAGLALLDQRRVIVHVNGTRALTTRETIEHELVHIALHESAGGTYLPRWYQEGVATLLSGEATYERLRAVTGAAALGQLDSLELLDRGFAGSQLAIERAYATAAGFVIFASRRSANPSAVADVQRLMQQGMGFDAAFRLSFGGAPAEWYAQYASHMEAAASVWAMVLSDSSIWSLVSALGMLSMLQAWRHRPRFDEVTAAAEEDDSEPLDLEAVAAAAESAAQRPWKRRDFRVDPLQLEVPSPGEVASGSAGMAVDEVGGDAVNTALSKDEIGAEAIATEARDGDPADDRQVTIIA